MRVADMDAIIKSAQEYCQALHRLTAYYELHPKRAKAIEKETGVKLVAYQCNGAANLLDSIQKVMAEARDAADCAWPPSPEQKPGSGGD